MVSPVENRSILTGRVLARSEHPSVARWDVLRVRVEAADDVEGMPNLLTETVGTELELDVDRDDLPAGSLEGHLLRGAVRLAGPETVVALPAAAGAGRLHVTGPGHEGDEPRPVL